MHEMHITFGSIAIFGGIARREIIDQHIVKNGTSIGFHLITSPYIIVILQIGPIGVLVVFPSI